jgi:hypothetical protein
LNFRMQTQALVAVSDRLRKLLEVGESNHINEFDPSCRFFAATIFQDSMRPPLIPGRADGLLARRSTTTNRL